MILAAGAAGYQTPDPQATTFKSGTRLVEVEVVVRDRNGPVTGMTKDAFTILDQGKPQRIDVFREGQSNLTAGTIPAPPGAVSNRGPSGSTAPSGYTAVLFDQLNTRLDQREYARKALVKFIRGMDPNEHIAIYVLGSQLHVLQEFTDDPAKLIAALQHVDSGRDLMPANVHDAMFGFNVDAEGNVITGGKMPAGLKAAIAGSTAESAANVAQVNAAINGTSTGEAITIIAHHLAGMPGRRNLVWMTENWMTAAPFTGMLQQSRIALYSVLARSLDYNPFGIGFGEVDMTADPGHCLLPCVIPFQRDNREFAAQTGGAGFDDAADVGLAVKRADEDSRSVYTLGYYPPEDLLDGKYHRLSVKVAGQEHAHLEIAYRPGYFAGGQPENSVLSPNAIAEAFQNPLDNSLLGISARCEPDSTAGLYKLTISFDLHDLHLIHENGHSKAKVQVGFLSGRIAQVHTILIDVTDEQLPAALRAGYYIQATGVPAMGNAIRMIARDPSTGVAGSLTIPVAR